MGNSMCAAQCCEVFNANMAETDVSGRKQYVRKTLYIAPWVKAVAIVFAALVFFSGLLAIAIAQAVQSANVQVQSVSVHAADGETLSLPGISYNGALYVEAGAYNKAFAIKASDTRAISYKYWGDQMYYKLADNGGLKVK